MMDRCLEYYIFCKHMHGIIYKKNKFDFWIDSYKYYLEICKTNPSKKNIPIVKEMFVWYAHMQYHDNYIYDVTNYLGYILNNYQFIERKNILPCDDILFDTNSYFG